MQFLPVGDVTEHELAEAALLSSLADETPEGRSIVELATDDFGLERTSFVGATLVPFTAQTRMSGVDIPANGVAARSVRKGAADSVKVWVQEQGGAVPPELTTIVDGISSEGGTPLVVAEIVGDGGNRTGAGRSASSTSRTS